MLLFDDTVLANIRYGSPHATRQQVVDAAKAVIVKLRFFVGLENHEIAGLLGISERTVERSWRFAKAWLLAEFQAG